MSTEIVGASEDIKSITTAHSASTSALTPLLLNSRVVVPLNDANANADNVFVYKAPRLKVDKNTGEAWTALGLVYWDDSAKNFTTSTGSGSNTLAGIIVADAASADTEGYIDLDPATFA